MGATKRHDVGAGRPILGIETSCDETAAAVVHGQRVLGTAVASQIAVHQRFGGVVPEIAARNHLLTILPVVELAMQRAGVRAADLGGIAVTNRPGLIGALLVGVHTAKALALAWQLPLVGVDHIAAHVWASQLRPPNCEENTWPAPALPFAALAVSGGHTRCYRVGGPGELVALGGTLDDAAGEAFDKCGKLLGLPYPGGPHIDQLAATGNPRAVTLPRGVLGRDDGAYSFSGLKTALRLHVERHFAADSPPQGHALADLCAGFQAAAVEQLVRVTLGSVRRAKLRDLVVAGGVAANAGLRAALSEACGKARVRFWPVPVDYCGDNGAMVAGLGEALLAAGGADDPLTLDAADTATVRRAGRAGANGAAP